MTRDAFKLKSYEFRRERQESWKELETLILRAGNKGVRGLDAKDLERLPVLYRAAVSSLSVARAISLDRNLVEYLDSLVSRAYFVVYGNKRRVRRVVSEFLLGGFPRAVRQVRWYLAIVTATLAVGHVIAYRQVVEDEEAFYSYVDRGLAGERGPESSREDLRAVLFGGDEQSSDELSFFSAWLIRHNSTVGLLAFSLGFMGGVPTELLIFETGGMLGAFAALHANRDLSVELWSWLLPHGVTEILAVLLCGAAGLVIGHAVLFPGREGRLVVLARRGRLAGIVVLGSFILFAIAGVIEGVFRQRVQSIPIRYTVAAATAVFWAVYFSLPGRRTA